VIPDAVRGDHANRAYLVLGGDGWTLRDYYTSGSLGDPSVDTSKAAILGQSNPAISERG
jgi:hypothetical protein